VPGRFRLAVFSAAVAVGRSGRISKDMLGGGHGVANQLADLVKRAEARGWTVVYRLSDNDIGVTRKDPTTAGKHRPGYEEALRLVDAAVPRQGRPAGVRPRHGPAHLATAGLAASPPGHSL
jgi:hypothetical protein